MTKSRAKESLYKGVKCQQILSLLEGSDQVVVKVGREDYTKTWHLPKSLLTLHSPFFEAAFNGKFTEATSRTITLPEDDPSTFVLFVQWLYVGEVSDIEFKVEWPDDDTRAVVPYIQAWILGDKLGCGLFQDHVMIALLGWHNEHFIRPQSLLAAYEGSASESKLRRWAIEQVYWDLRNGWLTLDGDEWAAWAGSKDDSGADFIQFSLNQGDDSLMNPYESFHRYVEVLTYKKQLAPGKASKKRRLES